MTIKEFFENENKLAIHCDTKEKSENLCKRFAKAGYKWRDGVSYDYANYFEVYDNETAYSNSRGYAFVSFYAKEGYKILRFEEIEDVLQ